MKFQMLLTPIISVRLKQSFLHCTNFTEILRLMHENNNADKYSLISPIIAEQDIDSSHSR